jgi:hypothetical protein
MKIHPLLTTNLLLCACAAVTWHEKDVGRFDVVDGRWVRSRRDAAAAMRLEDCAASTQNKA